MAEDLVVLGAVYNERHDLLKEYQALKGAGPADRGRALPRLLVRAFERAGFQAKEHARAATPRDTDLFLSYDDDYLLEAKWTNRRVDVDAVDGLRCRLGRTASHVVGLLVSVAGFTGGAIDLVRADRSRLILLLDGDDVEGLLTEGLSPATLLRVRKRALLRDATVLVGQVPVPDSGPPADPAALPRGDTRMTELGGAELPWAVVEGRSGDEVFVESIPDVDWTPAQGHGVGLDVTLPVATAGDLVRVLALLDRVGWVSGAGRFAIHQPDLAWHGTGARGFADALQREAQRHGIAGRKWHGEEHVVYFDHCPGGSGFYTLTSRVWTHRHRLVNTVLSAQLPGIPVDTTRIRLLLESLGLDELGYFRPLDVESRLQTWHFREGSAPLTVAAYLRQAEGEGWVNGIVTDNPLSRVAPDAEGATELPHGLRVADRLICSLRSWHLPTSVVGPHSLIRVEHVETGGAQVISITADWASAEAQTVGPDSTLSVRPA